MNTSFISAKKTHLDLDIDQVRTQFPILEQKVNGKPLIYFDNAATNQKPKQVIDALVNYYQGYNANIHRGIHTLAEKATKAFEETRSVMKKFINAKHVEEVIFTRGVTESINLVASSYGRAFLKEGDEVIIPTPYWVTYSELVKIARATVVEIRTSLQAGFKITPAELEAAITPKTKVFLFSSPCNPSGAVYSKAELEGLAEVFRKYPNIYIIADEIYEYINFVGKHESIAQFDDLKDRVILVNGLSKGFAMTGWRLGYIASNVDIAKACEKLQGQFTSATCSIAQKAGVTALTTDLKPSLEMTEEFTRRRAKVLDLIKDIPGFKCFEPEGAFYIFPDVSYYYGKSDGENKITNSADFSMYLLNTAHVSSVMGEAFGEPNCVRFSFANSMPNIERAWVRIKDALAKLK